MFGRTDRMDVSKLEFEREKSNIRVCVYIYFLRIRKVTTTRTEYFVVSTKRICREVSASYWGTRCICI